MKNKVFILIVLIGGGIFNARVGCAQNSITIGTGTVTTSSNGPFYNYYENNRTQILFLSSELGSAKSLTHLSLNIAAVTSDQYNRDFNNFTINLKHVSITNFNSHSDYESMTGATTVFSISDYGMPAATGWVTFDISDFAFNGTNNLIVEIIWGDNGEYCGSADYYKVNKTTNANNMVTYGYADATTPPAYSGKSLDRPNIRFDFDISSSTIGTGTVTTSSNGPFYNYYENNRTQILFLSSELGSAKSLTHLSLNIAAVTSDQYNRDFNNFTINLKHVSITNFNSHSDYESMTGATTVFSISDYGMPAATGWRTFDISDFAFNGTNNLIVEIIWGDNGEYCGSADYYKVNKTTNANNMVTYGYADATTPPGYSGKSLDRPNIRFDYFISCSAPTSVTATSSAASICTGTSVSFQYSTHSGGNVGGGSWEYEWRDGVTVVRSWNTAATYSPTLTATKTYQLYMRSTACNSLISPSSNNVTVTVHSQSSVSGATVNASPNPLCNGNSTTITLTPGTLGSDAIWTWYEGGCGSGGSVGTGISIVKSPSSNTTYYVRAESPTCGNTGCVNTAVTVDASPPTSVNAGDDIYLCTTTATMDATGTGVWTQISGPNTPDILSPSSPTSQISDGTPTLVSGTYVFRWSATNGCGTSSDYVVIIKQ